MDSKPFFETLKQTYAERDFSFISFCLMLFFLPISINISSLLLVISIGLKLIQVVILKQQLFASKALAYASIIGLTFFIYIILSSVIQVGAKETLSNFGKQFSRWELLFLVPILLKRTQNNHVLLYSFFTGLLTSILYVCIVAIIYQMSFDSHTFQKVIDLHHTYLSLFLLFFVNFLFIKHTYYKSHYPISRVLCGVFIIFSFLVIYFLESKVSMVVFSLLVIYHSISSFSKKNLHVFVAFGVALTTAFFFFNKKLKVSYLHAMDFRLEIWQESMKIFEDHPFFGSQEYSEKDLLNYGHYVTGKYYFMDCDLNSHNQYLSLGLKYGCVGLIIFFWYSILIFKSVNKTTTLIDIKEFFGFTGIVLVIFYIENILDRHHGFVFCTVFYSYYLLKIENAKV